jgi:hypothetical protein
MNDQPTSYRIDGDDRIVSVGGAWDSFVRENEGASILSMQVQGRSIWDFVAGETTRMWLEAVFQMARLRGEAMERSYRCDSPGLKRFMRMRLIPLADGGLQVEHQLLSTERRSPALHMRTDGHPASVGVMIRCSFCGQIQTGQGWLEPSQEMAGPSSTIPVAYSVCEPCRESIQAQRASI